MFEFGGEVNKGLNYKTSTLTKHLITLFQLHSLKTSSQTLLL